MMTHVIKSMEHESAKYIRDVEYIREMASTDLLDDNVANSEKQFEDEILNSDAVSMEAAELVSMMDDDNSEEEEISRIVESTKDAMTLDDVMGIVVE